MITPIILPSFDIAHPAILENAFRIHYEQHYLKYVNNTNDLIQSQAWIKNSDSLEDLIIILDPYSDFYNNAAQVWNHEFFFKQFSKNPNHKIGPKLECLIAGKFNSEEDFIKECINKGLSQFGSGYLWVYINEYGLFTIETGNNAENLVKRKKCNPILCIDLWEHSYYLDYQSARKNYLENIFKVIDWDIIEKRIKYELS